jgi:hypothetical protein
MRLRSVVLLVMAATLGWGAAIDGTWTAQVKVHGAKKTAAEDHIVEVKLDLKAEGDKPTGTVVSAAKKRSVTAKIVDGKIDGDQFSFTTVQTTKKGEQRLEWRGTVTGDTLKGTRSRAGAKRGQDFVAKRA